MTIGQRIAQKRKELGLSQEALGEQLGVTRQSIYKWESDAALPEIDKLIVLSKLFGVSVGWLLGVEELPVQGQADASSAQQDAAENELTETQLKLVEEIVERYLAAQPKPKRRKWPWLLAVCVVLLLGARLIDRLDEINRQYQMVQSSVNQVQNSVYSQVNGISDRVEEILKAQNSLTADYGAEISDMDLAKNQICFSVYAVPKTYTDGMQVKFSVDTNGSGIQTASGEEGLHRRFSATLTADLTDSLTLSVTFLYPDGTQQTQILGSYQNLYSNSLPSVDLSMDSLWSIALEEKNIFTIPAPNNEPIRYIPVGDDPNANAAPIASIQVGLFKNQTLVAWAQPCETPDSFFGYGNYDFYALPDLEVSLAEGDVLCNAVVLTDVYGRTVVRSGWPVIMSGNGIDLTYSDFDISDTDPALWSY